MSHESAHLLICRDRLLLPHSFGQEATATVTCPEAKPSFPSQGYAPQTREAKGYQHAPVMQSGECSQHPKHCFQERVKVYIAISFGTQANQMYRRSVDIRTLSCCPGGGHCFSPHPLTQAGFERGTALKLLVAREMQIKSPQRCMHEKG